MMSLLILVAIGVFKLYRIGGEYVGLMKRWRETRQRKKEEERASTLEELLLSAGIITEAITKEQALNIPAVSACVNVISDTVASLPIYLYKEVDEKVEQINDARVNLLNDDTGDTLDGFQFKKALVTDYLLSGVGYTYINKQRNNVKSLHYVDNINVSVMANHDPIFKQYDILVNGLTYRDFDFIKVTKSSKDGVTGKGIIDGNNKMLSVTYNSLIFEELLLKTGGNKKGFLKSQSKLTKEAMTELKTAWKNLYSNNTENVMLLNNGIEFQEASQSSVEMQLNEQKKTNSNEVCKIFLTPPAILDGSASTQVYNNWIKTCILPILKAIITALNKDLLLTVEKESFYFAFDTNELLKGDMLSRFQAYAIGIKNSFLEINDVRFAEDYEPLEAFNDTIKLNLGDVLYNTKTKTVYTPNTDKASNVGSNTSQVESQNEEVIT